MGKRLFGLCLCLALVLTMTSCGGKEEDNDFVGEWYCGRVEQIQENPLNKKKERIDVTQAAGTQSTLTIKSNGNAKIMLRSDFANEDISGEWEYTDANPDILIVRVDDGNDVEIRKGKDGTVYVDDDVEIVINRYVFWRSE